MALYPNPLNRLKDRLRGAPPAVTLNPLSWSWTEGFAFENAAAGTLIGTPVGKTEGSALSIVAVTSMAKAAGGDADFIPASTALFQIAGDALHAGSVAMDYETAGNDLYGHGYLVTVRETLRGTTRDTVLPVLVYDLPEAGSSIVDTFDAADDTKLVGRSIGGVTWTSSGTQANYDQIKITGNRLSIPGLTSSNIAFGVLEMGSLDLAVSYDLAPTTPYGIPVYLRRTSSTNYVRFGTNSATGRSINIYYRSTASGSEVSAAVYTPVAGQAIPVTQSDGSPTQIGIILVGNAFYITYNGNVVVPDGATSARVVMANPPATTGTGVTSVMIPTQGTAALMIDTLRMSAVVGFSVSSVPKVVAANPATGFATIALRGGYTAPPAQLQWRLKTAAGAIVPGYDWHDLGATIGGGAWRKFVQVPAPASVQNYIIEIQDAADTATILATNAFGVGETLMMIGQSNQAHMGDPVSGTTSDYPGAQWMVFGTGSEKAADGLGMTGVLNTMAALFATPVLAVNTAAGNRSALNWAPNAPYEGNSIQTNGLIMFDNAIGQHRKFGSRITAICIDQGEVDRAIIGSNGAQAWVDQWITNLRAICAALGQRYQDTPVHVAMTGTYASNDNKNSDSSDLLQIKLWEAQRLLVSQLALGALSHHKLDVLADHETANGGSGMIHHLPVEYPTKLGPRFAYSIAKLRGKAPYDRRGPRIASMTRVGAVLTLPLDLNGCASVAADAGVLGGFQVVGAAGYDGSQAPASYFTSVSGIKPISSVALSGNTIVVMLAADPGGPVALRYAVGASATSFDGCSPFGQQYYGTTDTALPPMIKGTYANGDVVGLDQLVAGLAA